MTDAQPARKLPWVRTRLLTGHEETMAQRFELVTKLCVEECLERLRRSTSPYPLFQIRRPAKRTFYCKVADHKVRLSTLGPGQLWNSFMPFLNATLHETPKGTVVQGRLRPHGFVIALLVLYVAGALGLAAVLAWAALTGHGVFIAPPIVALLVPLCMAAIGILAALLGVALGRDHERELLRFIRATLEAG